MLDRRPVCDLEIRLGTPLELGTSFRGRRRIIPITGGRVLGEHLRGAVLPAAPTGRRSTPKAQRVAQAVEAFGVERRGREVRLAQ